MSDEKPIPAAKPRHSRSLFAPIVLIAAGVFFLLANLGRLGGLDWQTALAYWPLALIFIGLNVLVVQLRPPLGTLLSGLVAVVAVVVFGWLLLSGAPAVGALRGLGLPAPRELRQESFSMTPGTAETAAITLHLGNLPADIAANDGENLVAGTIWTRTGVEMIPRSDADDHVAVEIGETGGGWTFDPREWLSPTHQWQIFLSPDLPIDLTIDAGNGGTTADLTELDLSALTIDAGNAQTSAALPPGKYRVAVDGGNGGTALTLPAGVAARVEYDEGNGAVVVDDRFRRISGDGDEGVYETDGYDPAEEGVLIVIDGGNGRVTVGE